MSGSSVVIVGTGQAGFQAAASLRQEGFDGAIALIGEEPGLPYQRPPLSKAYLKEGNSDRLVFRSADFFETNDITLIDGTRADRIDRRDRVVEAGGHRHGYDHLILATGARNRTLPLEGTHFDNVVELRTVAHADTLRAHLDRAAHAVIIGGGFIGLEFAAVAAAAGKRVTILEAAPRLMARAVREPMSEDFLAAHRAAGAEIHLNSMVQRIRGDGYRDATGVELADGRQIDGDLILIAAGAIPNCELAEDAGLATDNGIVVDETLRTEDPAISAIGDCAAFIDPRTGDRVRLESVQNAADQAKCVAARIAGRPAGYDTVPWFWSDQGDRKLQIAGLTGGADFHVVQSADTGRLSVFCFREGRFIGLETVNTPADHMAARKLLATGGALTLADFEALDFDLKALRAETGG